MSTTPMSTAASLRHELGAIQTLLVSGDTSPELTERLRVAQHKAAAVCEDLRTAARRADEAAAPLGANADQMHARRTFRDMSDDLTVAALDLEAATKAVTSLAPSPV